MKMSTLIIRIMKKVLLIAAVVLTAASCSMIHRAQVSTTPVYSPVVETTTMATLEVSPKKITYNYVPDRKSAMTLPQAQLVQNAIYAALEENGNADELVEVSYYVSAKRGLLTKRVRSISVTGYPAYYVDFREPSESDLKSVETLSRSRMMREADVKSVELRTAE